MKQIRVDRIGLRLLNRSDRRCDLFEVPQKHIPSISLRGNRLTLSQKARQRTADVLDTEPELFFQFGRRGDRFFRFARKRNPDAGHVDDQGHRSHRQGVAGLGESIGTPVGTQYRLGDRAGRLLELQGDSVGKPIDLHRLAFGDIGLTHHRVKGIELGFRELLRTASRR